MTTHLPITAVGMSGLVEPAASFVGSARVVGGTSWLVNADRPANVDRFDHVVLGPAGQVLPALLT